MRNYGEMVKIGRDTFISFFPIAQSLFHSVLLSPARLFGPVLLFGILLQV